MITKITDFEAGACKIIGLASVNILDLESAEIEVFPDVIGGIVYTDVKMIDRALFASFLKYFVFCTYVKNRNQFQAGGGQITKGARDFGNASTKNLIDKWAIGVNVLESVIDRIRLSYPNAYIKAEIMY